MISRPELAAFIEKVANGDYSSAEWNVIAVNHYQDPVMEAARREMVKE